MTTNEKIKQLESQLADLKQEMAGKWQPDNDRHSKITAYK